MKKILIGIFLLLSGNVFSQLGFCPGSKGDAIFHETFGAGTGTGAALPANVTSYDYVTGDPNDGQYTISSRIGQDNGSWHGNLPGTTISKGKALIVNADFTAGKFYETRITGLCEATTYEFSAFLMNVYDASTVNVCEGSGIPVNVRFEIWDKSNTHLLADGSTGDIHGSNAPRWEQYGLIFTSEAGQDEIILKMFNNGNGGCGNDLAIDDIVFASCGDLTEVRSPDIGGSAIEICEPDAPVSVDLTATPDNTVYTRHAFQWQESLDKENWQDIPGETGRSFSSPPLSSTRYYRVKVAEDAVNLSSNFCSSASEPFAVIVVETPEAPASAGDVNSCEGSAIPPLKVAAQLDETVLWYTTASGGSEIATGSSFFASAAGTYYAGAVKTGFDCEVGPRTPVTLTVNPTPQVSDEVRQLCNNNQIELVANIGNYTYLWNTGATTAKILVGQPGNYSVTITNVSGCSAVKNFMVNPVEVAGIADISSEGTTVTIEPLHAGEFEFSLDGQNFQRSNIFQNIPGGVYTAYVRDLEKCNTVSEEFPHIVLPKFITPNNDGLNDRFEMRGVEYFSSSEIRIFDRFGKLLALGSGAGFSWNGTYSGRELPAEDYWYYILIEGFEPLKGHFTLKR